MPKLQKKDRYETKKRSNQISEQRRKKSETKGFISSDIWSENFCCVLSARFGDK